MVPRAHHHWLVDPELCSVEILELDEHGKYVPVVSATEGPVSVPGCPGLVLDVDALWRELEQAVAEGS